MQTTYMLEKCSGKYSELALRTFIISIIYIFDSIQKVGPSGIQTHDLVLTVHTLYCAPSAYLLSWISPFYTEMK